MPVVCKGRSATSLAIRTTIPATYGECRQSPFSSRAGCMKGPPQFNLAYSPTFAVLFLFFSQTKAFNFSTIQSYI